MSHPCFEPPPLCCACEGVTCELRSGSLNCGHSIKLFGQIDSQKQNVWGEALSLCDKQRSIRTVNLDWLRAGPRTCWFALKSTDKFNFRHDAPPHFSRQETREECPACPSLLKCKGHSASRQRANSGSPTYPPRVTIWLGPASRNGENRCHCPAPSFEIAARYAGKAVPMGAC